MRILRDKARYAAYCAATPAVPLCAHPWYLDGVTEGGSWSVVMIEDVGNILAAWPYFEKRRWGLRYVPMPLFTKHLGILPAPAAAAYPKEQLVRMLVDALPRFAGFDQQFHPSANAYVPHLPASYSTTAHYLHRIDLADGNDWRAGINRNMRRNIRKADAHLQLLTELDIETFYQVNTLSFTRQGLAMPYTLEQLRRHDATLATAERRQIFAAVDAEGRLHSVAYLTWDDRSAYYHLSGDDPALRRGGSGIWLIAQALDYAQHRLGLPVFDFEGSMIPAVAAIREQFGAERTTYYRVREERSWWYRMGKRIRF